MACAAKNVRLLAKVLKSGAQRALEISISPPNGVYISKIKKIAPETDNAATNKAVITVALRGPKSPKVMKIAAQTASPLPTC